MDTLLGHQIRAADRAGQLPLPSMRTRAQLTPVLDRPDQGVILSKGTGRACQAPRRTCAQVVATGEARL
jgi:hypothetical protein